MAERIAFVGGGNMALALATRLANANTSAIVVADPVAAQRARFAAPIATTASNQDAASGANVVVLAVKPQVLEAATRDIAAVLGANTLVLSIAAGVPLVAIERWLRGSRAVVRCMPNTPALIGLGITGLFANPHVNAQQRAAAQTVMAAAGEVIWFEREDELDAVTALSGSGPAYFFQAIEALIAAGRELGLAPEAAKRLVVATAAGAAALARDEDPSLLRERVTSPGGTTERALFILAEKRFPDALRNAAHGAFTRARELRQEFGES